MYLNAKKFLELGLNQLVKFIELKIKEDMYLDYKVDLSSNEKRKAYKEFLKDVTAFANANGGNIMIGVKEPSDILTTYDQIQGIDNADELAQSLERVTISSIDPRISGLKIKTISLANGNSVIAIHIPPSLSRPHMVNYEGHKTFYIRHSESSFPMTTSEIRQAVMQTFTMEENVKKYLIDKEEDIKHYFINDIPTFIIQAIPLISPEPLWDVYDEKIDKILRGHQLNYTDRFALKSYISPRATIDGILGTDARQDPKWQTEIHRNGYVSCTYRNEFINYQNPTEYIVHSDFRFLFDSFFIFLEAILEACNTDLPYIISCKYYGANNTRMLVGNHFTDNSSTYYKEDIVFPFHYHQVGEEFENISEALCKELFNAYGYIDVRE